MIKELIVHLAVACAPNVAPETIDQIINIESAYNEFAVSINYPSSKPYPPFKQPTDLAGAMELVEEAFSNGRSVSIGLMQVSSENLEWLDLSIIDLFDPCKNVGAGGTILTHYYEDAAKRMGEGQDALLSALSSYNTGDPLRGFTNGYIDRYIVAARGKATDVYEADIDSPTHLQALYSDTSINIPDFMKPEQTMPKSSTENDDSITSADDINVDTDSIYKAAEIKPVSVRQDVADEMGVFEEKAISDEDIDESAGDPIETLEVTDG